MTSLSCRAKFVRGPPLLGMQTMRNTDPEDDNGNNYEDDDDDEVNATKDINKASQYWRTIMAPGC